MPLFKKTKGLPEGDDIILNKLKEVSFFSMFENDAEVLGKIASICARRQYRKGKMIIREGDFGDELFIILNGEIDIIKNTLQNESYTVTTLSADLGSINVGEIALIDNDRRSASVVAQTDCECLVINRDDFIRFGDENPTAGLAITRAIASQLCAYLRKSNSDIITLFSALVEEISATQ
ncbi:MAG TPA: cyclic nucleotide-binding domain-containing protein [Spirochaetota bacterium]|nr:cyclic nucleotide-binding domain-containing protein [Spirochaetota bacterium]HPC42703.1 cyclic nucleotide-binding domain-containing protein [Spirochaetota bacterium]HPL15770.1 cyclic nucleotide-binding domain-containing protein [Spirochaetota bacterium]HQF07828.1 cyclic nucleotide-binding domain-containing protein [Spirochaetota bacterium]HQH96881.1 cyclic nucleotide-binding domain-containing protein [Spirochaetota bacterium]